jgi:hypothetical protein
MAIVFLRIGYRYNSEPLQINYTFVDPCANYTNVTVNSTDSFQYDKYSGNETLV